MPPYSPKPINMRIRNDVTELAVVRSGLERVGNEIGLPEKVLTPLLVGVDELVGNVIKYGWPDATDGAIHEINICIMPGADSIEIEIIDDGQAFDPDLAPKPKPPLPGRRPRPGGIGLYMVRKLVDDIRYKRVDGRNHTVITKRYRLSTRRGIR